MKTVEVSGRTVDEALQAALAELELKDVRDLEFEILEEPSKGFLGLVGGRPARVRAWAKASPDKKACQFLEGVIDKMGIEAEVKAEEADGYLHLQVFGENVGLLIGRRGRTLDALQYLVNLVANRGSRGEPVRIILDVASYRKRRAQTLQNLARRLSERVRRQKREIALEPMTPQERRIIHLAVQEEEGVISYSEGEEPFRKIIIALRD